MLIYEIPGDKDNLECIAEFMLSYSLIKEEININDCCLFELYNEDYQFIPNTLTVKFYLIIPKVCCGYFQSLILEHHAKRLYEIPSFDDPIILAGRESALNRINSENIL